MRWTGHKILTGAILYVFNTPLEGVVAGIIGSVFPDGIEFVFRSRHRGFSHFWGIYLIPLIAITYFPLFFLSHGIPDYVLFLVKYFLLGCLLHLLQDAMSKSGIPFWPGTGKKIRIGDLYVTRTSSETRVVFLLLLFLAVLKFLSIVGSGGERGWLPQPLFYKKITG